MGADAPDTIPHIAVDGDRDYLVSVEGQTEVMASW